MNFWKPFIAFQSRSPPTEFVFLKWAFYAFNGYANGFGQNGLIEVGRDLEAMHSMVLVAKWIEFCF